MTSGQPASLRHDRPLDENDLSPTTYRQFQLLAALAVLPGSPTVSELQRVTRLGNAAFYRTFHKLHSELGIRTVPSTHKGERCFKLASWGIINKRVFLQEFGHLAKR